MISSLTLVEKLTPLWWHNATSLLKYLKLYKGLQNIATGSTYMLRQRTTFPFSPNTLGIVQSIIKALDPLQDRLTLCKLMYVSRIFRTEAEIALYQDVGLGMNIGQHHRFLYTVSQSSRLGGLVGRYEFLIFGCARDVTAETLATFKFAIPLMVNLQEFRFTGANDMSLAYAILPHIDNVNMQLKSLYWRGSALDEEQVARFLTHQKALTELNIIWTNSIAPESSLHYVKALTGNSWTIRILLPGRNITELYWILDLELYITTLATIQPALDAFSRIRILSFGGDAVDKLLSHILPYLTSVEILELITMNGRDVPGHAHRIPNLRVLVLSKSQDCIFPALRQNHHEIAGELFCMNRNINRVDIVERNPLQIRADCYYRWSRYSSQLTIVSVEEALVWKRM